MTALDSDALGAAEAIERWRSGRLSFEALVRACAARIALREPTVKAWTHVGVDAAIGVARDRDVGAAIGALHGIPIGVKDVIDTYDMPAAYGSPIYADHRPAADAACIAMCRRAGAIVLGKTVTTEFATRHPGRTTNPRRPSHTPGGSSSGSAAAVADGMVPLALGTQTGGSIIRPASYCGVVGFKPSFGVVSRAGVKPLSESLDTVGGFARSVEDICLLMSAMTGLSEYLQIRPTAPDVVGECAPFPTAIPEPDMHAAMHRLLGQLRRTGIDVVATSADPLVALPQVHRTIEYFEIARSLQDEYRRHESLLTPALRSRIAEGLAINGSALADALRQAHAARQRVDEWFGDAQVLVAPSASGEAPPGLTSTGNAAFNRHWTLLGLPCLSIPFATGKHGLPLGVQLIGRHGDDANVLATGWWLETLLRHDAHATRFAR